MPGKPVRIAVIGHGRWGKNIVRTLEGLEEATLAHTVTRNYMELLSQDDIGAVVIATPPATHAGVALPFLQKGLPVFIEKPLTLTLADARRLFAASKKYRAPIFVGHVHLYNPAYLVAKDTVKKLGKLKMMIGEGANNGPFREDYSAMWDWAPHDLSMMLDIAGEKPSSVQAWGEALTRPHTTLHDFALMRVNFPSGLFGIVYSSHFSPEKRRKFTVVGSRSSVIYDDVAEKKVTLFTKSGPRIGKYRVKENQPVISYPTYAPYPPLAEELRAFIKMIKTKKKPRTNIESAIRVVKVLEAAERSISLGGSLVKIKK